MGLISSIIKSNKLKKISKVLVVDPDKSIDDTFNDFFFGSRGDILDKALFDLFKLAKKDPHTNILLDEYKIDKDSFRDLYWSLIKNGGVGYRKGHWIPASSLVFGATLEYVLKAKNNPKIDMREVVYQLKDYFGNNKTGEVVEDLTGLPANDKKNETVITWHPNGRKESEIILENGVCNSTETWWHDNGEKSSEKHYENDILNGIETYWSENGQKEWLINYKNGKKQGGSTYWNEGGNIVRTETHNNGIFVNSIRMWWYDNGQMEIEGNFIADDEYGHELQHGDWTWWHDNGEKSSEKHYENGLTIGNSTGWHKNGQKSYEGFYDSNGKEDGIQTAWYDNGQKEYEENYKSGEEVGTWTEWLKDGTKNSERIITE